MKLGPRWRISAHITHNPKETFGRVWRFSLWLADEHAALQRDAERREHAEAANARAEPLLATLAGLSFREQFVKLRGMLQADPALKNATCISDWLRANSAALLDMWFVVGNKE